MPNRETDISTGLVKFEEELRHVNLRLDKAHTHRYRDRLATYFVITSGKKYVDLVLTDEFLCDFPNTKEQFEFLRRYLEGVRKRIENPSPYNFYCVSEAAVKIEIEWPVQWVPNRAASFVWIRIRDLKTELVSACSAIMTHQLEIMDTNLKLDPFLREEILIANVRNAIDRRELEFYEPGQLPTELPSLRVQKHSENGPAIRSEDLHEFLLGKIYWLGFKQGDRSTRVWVTDPWDAVYLGVDPRSLLRAAQTLEASDYIRVDAEGFATADRNLLINANRFEPGGSSPRVRRLGFSAE